MSFNKPIWKLRDWINKNEINFAYLSYNENAIELLKKNQDKINYNYLSRNISIFIKYINNDKQKKLSRILYIILKNKFINM